MPAKKKEPKFRWVEQKPSWFDLMVFSRRLKLQEWSETQNKYVDVPVVQEH